MYTLYGTRGSGSAAVEVALEACALPFRIVRAAEWEADSAVDELRRVNPLGQIPTLAMPDGSVMTESAAILIHLGLHVVPPGSLIAADARARAQAIRGLVYIAANCYSCITISDYPGRFTTAEDKETHEAIRQGTRRQLYRNWDVFADTFVQPLGAGAFLSGPVPGALDFLAAVVSRWSGARAHVKEQRPAFHELLQRIDSHPSVAPVFARHWPAA